MVMKSTSFKDNKGLKAFTLIELLTVIAVIAVLAAILIPAVGKVRTKAMRTETVANLRQVASAFNMYAADNKGWFPVGYQYQDPAAGIDAENWRDSLAQGGYLGQEDKPANGSGSFGYEYSVMGSPLQWRNYPDKPAWNWATFSANSNVLGFNETGFEQTAQQKQLKFEDPTRTMLVSEGSTHGNKNGQFNGMIYGQNQSTLPDYLENGEVSCAFLDGHVETMPLEEWPSIADSVVGNDAWKFWYGRR